MRDFLKPWKPWWTCSNTRQSIQLCKNNAIMIITNIQTKVDIIVRYTNNRVLHTHRVHTKTCQFIKHHIAIPIIYLLYNLTKTTLQSSDMNMCFHIYKSYQRPYILDNSITASLRLAKANTVRILPEAPSNQVSVLTTMPPPDPVYQIHSRKYRVPCLKPSYWDEVVPG